MISEDDIILLKRMIEKSEDNNGFVLKTRNGKTYVSSSLSEVFENAKNEKEFEYLLMNSKKTDEKSINYIKKKTGKYLKIYLLNEDKIIEAKI